MALYSKIMSHYIACENLVRRIAFESMQLLSDITMRVAAVELKSLLRMKKPAG